ncbi:phosphatidylglycerophosphatase A [Limnohabitans sp. Rim8]|uniref:Phosphatidylglycerophosphatase A n=1 Tax=Limnohabitans curvus TaxID=323423 RepID=A0A315EN73_9BURK|nr:MULTISPECIES: phosphatidylglycerophosphatase A [Limnohabitans]PUE53811.1 phosphatidylglycerophosphatase A [Limnohabitans sp. Rim8]PUE59223.1 phosphatidylglycerophosphatase A [Limnohabitans curvus]
MLNRRFLLSHPAHFIALGAGSGLSRLAPGTAGTLWAWAVFLLLQIWLTPLQMGMLIAASTLVGWWACTVTAQHMGVADPGAIVWDEVIAFWLVLWLVTPTTFWGQLGAFVLFRYFDAAKPGPVRWADSLFKGLGWRGGWGIIFDDLVAAFCTLLVIAIWRSL